MSTDHVNKSGGMSTEQIAKKNQQQDSVLDYPDGLKADSGNWLKAKESDFVGLTFPKPDKTKRKKPPKSDPSSTEDPPPSLPDKNVKGDDDTHSAESWDSAEYTPPPQTQTPWAELSVGKKVKRIVSGMLKVLGVMFLMYLFVCALDILSVSLRLMSGKSAGKIFQDSSIINKPVAGIMIGIIFTALVQSSSTSTSVIISMVSARIIKIRAAIPMIMGCNIGTSLTSSLVAFCQVADKHQFKRAFAGATVHDLFNTMTTVVLLCVEMATHYLEELTGAIVSGIPASDKKGAKVDTLNALTKPFVNRIIRLDKYNCWGEPNCTNTAPSLIHNTTICYKEKDVDDCLKKFIFSETSWSDMPVGVVLFLCSLLTICLCLIIVVKILNSALKGHIAVVIRKVANAKIPHCGWMTGYLSILVGLVMTFLVQSSSVFTSAMTPLVGFGVISIEVMYPLTLGSNIGTTTTAILASFAVDPKRFQPAFQAALVHLFFNLTGMLIFYPIPFMRWPVFVAKKLGKICCKYRWFSVVYISGCFGLLPGIFLGLSVAGDVYVYIWSCFVAAFIASIVIVNIMQKKCPRCLCICLRTWNWLPKPLHSLEPWNRCMMKAKCCRKIEAKNVDVNGGGGNIHKFGTAGRGASNVSLVSFSIEKNSNRSQSDQHGFRGQEPTL